MKIKIEAKDICEYICGNISYDPIELIIDPMRYEVYDVSIYDNETKQFYDQSEKYKYFQKRVSDLRALYRDKEVTVSEVSSTCRDLQTTSPTEINLTIPIEYGKEYEQ